MSRRMIVVAAAATLITAAGIGINYAFDPCLFFINTIGALAFRFVLLWTWIVTFCLLKKAARIGLTISTAIVLGGVFLATYESSFQARVQTQAVKALREQQGILEEARKSDSKKSYPSQLAPIIVRSGIHKYYKFDYVPSWSKATDRFDSYEIVATPFRRECGFYRSFVLTSDGVIHHTLEPRAATAADPSI